MSQEATPFVFHNPSEHSKPSTPRFSKRKLLLILGIIILLVFLAALYFSFQNQPKPQQPQPTPKREVTYYPPDAYEPEQLIIQYKSDRISEQLNDFDKNAGVISKIRLFKETDDETSKAFYILKLKPGTNVIDVEKLYLEQDYIEAAHPNLILYPFTVPNDPYYGSMWNLQKIQMPQAWDLQKGSNSVIAAVIDTGIDYTHTDMPTNILRGRDYFNGDNDPKDAFGHGTHVAGTIGAQTNNGVGISGINWQVKLMAIKVCSDNLDPIRHSPPCNLAAAAQGIDDAVAAGAKVINLSLGGPGNCEAALSAKVQNAISRGVLIVAAAGNDSIDASTITPANCPGIFTVGASGQNDERAIFPAPPGRPPGGSNYGSRVNIAAPGVNIYSTVLSNCTNPYLICNSSGYLAIPGTSMSAPHVTGVAALLFAQNPSWNPQQVKDCILSSADPITTDLPIGGKRLNAYRALTTCGSSNPPPPAGPPPPNTPPPPSGGSNLPPPDEISEQPTPFPEPEFSCQNIPSNLAGQQLQLRRLQCSLSMVTTPQPPPPTTPSTPIDFSSASLDWDDVKVFLLDKCTLSRSSSCNSELNQAVVTEIGDITVRTILPGSRAWICNGNVACRTRGYSAYDGAQTLPTFTPTQACQNEFNACVASLPDSQALIRLYPELTDTNCDESDGICTTDPIKQSLWWH